MATMRNETKRDSASSGEDAPLFRQSALLVKHDELLGPSPQVELPQLVEAAISVQIESDSSTPWDKRVEEKLFQRRSEEAILRQNYEVFKQRPTTSFLLISGEAGTGKTMLARSLCDTVEKDGGYFVNGKYDRFGRLEPYRAWVSALTSFTKLVSARGEDEVKRIREAVLEAVGEEAFVLTDMIPALECILGPSSHDDLTMNGGEQLQRFVFVFKTFMRAICSPERPFVLLIDDLQWADPCSLDLFCGILLDHKNEGGLIVIGTCDESVTPDSYLAAKLRELEDKGGTRITNILLKNLDTDAIAVLLEDSLGSSRQSSIDLAQLVSNQTNGNFFCITEFLRWLQESCLLVLDTSTRSWSFDVDEIRMTVSTRQVRDFVLDKLRRLSPETKEVLKVAACMGSCLEEELIGHVLEMPFENALSEAVAQGVLVVEKAGDGYEFEHDDLREAAYLLIPEEERELFHVEVARRLWRKLDNAELDRHLFVVLSQFNMGSRLVTRENEKRAIAFLCLHAGQRAAKSSTFRVALVYISLGIRLLPRRSWRDDYDLTLSLYNAAAEMEMALASYDKMEVLLKEVFSHARSDLDKVQSYATRISALGARDNLQEAMNIGIQVLRRLGERFPSRLCLAHVMSEMKAVRRLLKGKSNEHLLRLPRLEDERKLASLRIINNIYLYALMARPKLAPFLALKAVKITLQHGQSVFAALAFSIYGMTCLSAMRSIEDAFRFAELSLEFLDQYGAREYVPRVYAAVYGVIWSWKRPITESLEPLLRAHRIGLQTRDTEFASLCSMSWCYNSIEAGVTLGQINQGWEVFSDTMMAKGQDAMLRMGLPFAQAVHHYMGLSPDPLSPIGDLVDYDEYERQYMESGRFAQLGSIRMCRMTVAYIFNDYKKAGCFIDGISEIWMMPPTCELVSIIFFYAMVTLALARDGKSARKYVACAKRSLRLLRQWSDVNPRNFLDNVCLVEAELASVIGKDAEAHGKFLCAVALARDSGNPMMEAVCCERAARHFFAKGEDSVAEKHFRSSLAAYHVWGAMAKVDRLEAELKTLYPECSQSQT